MLNRDVQMQHRPMMMTSLLSLRPQFAVCGVGSYGLGLDGDMYVTRFT